MIENGWSVLMFAAGVLMLLCSAAFVWLYWQAGRREREYVRAARAELADLTVLFQAMRDLLAQQKTLARDFNDDLERKMAVVKQVLGATMTKNERIFERQQLLARQLDEAKAQMESLRRLSGSTEFPSSEPTAPTPSLGVPAPEVLPTNASVAVRDGLWEATPEQAGLDTPDGTSEAADSPAALEAIENPDDPWEALPDTPSVSAPAHAADAADEVLDEVPATPEANGEDRDAFRALLDLDPLSGPEVSAPKPSRDTSRSALQRRVVEYSGAGMPVSDIARELGIGKGEVRLMLSLARQRTA